MTRRNFAALTGLFPLAAQSAENAASFPAASWETVSPRERGWCLAKLEAAQKFHDSLPPASVLVVDRGQVVVQWEDPARRIKVS